MQAGWAWADTAAPSMHLNSLNLQRHIPAADTTSVPPPNEQGEGGGAPGPGGVPPTSPPVAEPYARLEAGPMAPGFNGNLQAQTLTATHTLPRASEQGNVKHTRGHGGKLQWPALDTEPLKLTERWHRLRDVLDNSFKPGMVLVTKQSQLTDASKLGLHY